MTEDMPLPNKNPAPALLRTLARALQRAQAALRKAAGHTAAYIRRAVLWVRTHTRPACRRIGAALTRLAARTAQALRTGAQALSTGAQAAITFIRRTWARIRRPAPADSPPESPQSSPGEPIVYRARRDTLTRAGKRRTQAQADAPAVTAPQYRRPRDPDALDYPPREQFERVGSPINPFRRRLRRRNALLSLLLTTVSLVLALVLIAGSGGAGMVIGIAKAYMATTPTLDISKIEDQNLSSFIYDANGDLITTFVGTENRVYATIEQIPLLLQQAFIAIEDTRFLSHKGVDYKRIVGAFFSNLFSSNVQGGSTITQQLIKLRLLSSEQTYKRKIQEAWMAMQLETRYTKEEILEAYLNTINLAQNNYGVLAASLDYFDKELDELTLRECAMLAGLAQSPYMYDPRRNTYTRDRMDITDKRTDTVLLRMYQTGVITHEQYQQALVAPVHIKEKSNTYAMYEMPYFVEYAISDLVTHMIRQRALNDDSKTRAAIENELRTGGYHIYLTVDPTIQHIVEDTLFTWDSYPKMANAADAYELEQSGASFTRLEMPQAAAAVIDYHAGEYKAIVGGRQQPTAKKTFNRASQSHMPVGSSIKPIAVYGPAIDKGASPGSIVMNIPTKIAGWGGRGYPGGSAFNGPITLREAMVRSLNTPTARTLMDRVGIQDSVQYLNEMGIPADQYLMQDGPGLSLGTSGITVAQMAGAFGTFGNEGEYIEPLSFSRVVDKDGKIVLDAQKVRERHQVFKPSTAYLLCSMLVDAVNRGTGSRAKVSGMTIGGKTGTNSDYVGVFFAGLSPYYSAAVWVGSDRYKPLHRDAQGGRVAAPIFASFMKEIHATYELENKPLIDKSPKDLDLVSVKTCGVSGKLTTEACATDLAGYTPVTDLYLKGTQPTEQCDMHYQVRTCKVSGKVAGPYCPPDDIEQKSVLIVPQDSPIRDLDSGNLAKLFPNALLDFPSSEQMSAFRYDNALYAKYFCDVHTQQWQNDQQALGNAISQGKATINDARALLEQYANSLSESTRNTLSTRINALNAVLNAPEVAVNYIRQSTSDLRSAISSARAELDR